MTIRIKSWAKFQHFKDRRPPWVKLYRDLLDDMEWHQLEPRAAKTLVMLWLIASENDGELPEAKTLAFRLRTNERSIVDVLNELSHWLERDDIEPISAGHQGDAPETEKEKSRERDRQARVGEFETFYAAYPKHEGKAPALKAWAKCDAPIEVLLAAVKRQSASENWQKEKGRYIPLPATWLNDRRWEDSGVVGEQTEWHQSRSGVEGRAAELGIDLWDETCEQWPQYRQRVMKAAQLGAH